MNRLSMRACVRVATVLLALALSSTGAHAQFVPVSQERYVFESIGEDFFIITAPDFAPFTASLTTATHASTILSDHIFGQGSAGPDPVFGVNSATSYFRLVFDVPSATEFAFTGGVSTGEFGSAFAHLSSPGNEIVNIAADEFQSANWNESGLLAPGQYTLELYASNSIVGQLSTFEFALAVPGPGGLGIMLALSAVWMRPRRRRA